MQAPQTTVAAEGTAPPLVSSSAPAASPASPLTCSLVALQASAGDDRRGNDQTSTATSLSFTVPARIAVIGGAPRGFVAVFEFGPTSAESSETECIYRRSGLSFALDECHARMGHGRGPKAGDAVSGKYFELHVGPGDEDDNRTVTARVEIGSVPLSDNNPCTTDACGPHGGVTHTPLSAGTTCSAGNVCSGASTCNAAGSCIPGTPPVIDDHNPCTTDACTAATGVTHTPLAAGSSCTDGNACNGAETCNATGACTAGTPPVVDDGNPCTSDSCSLSTGVTHTPIAQGTVCGSSTACTSAATCSASGSCVAGAALPVDDGNPCTADSCSVATGVTHVPVAQGTSCGPGNVCTSASSCNATGSCLAGSPISTDDGNACTVDSCSVATGVVHVAAAAGTQCGPGDVCTTASTCNATASCVAGSPVVIDDLNPCTADSCGVATGITHAPVAQGSQCGPGDVCTGASTCNATGTCLVGSAAVIDDGNACTSDACSPATGVTHTPVASGTSCSDGNACNGGETCGTTGTCVAGAPPVIDTSNPCLIGSCNPATGVSYSNAAVGTVCGGDVCAGTSTCTSAGACQAGAPPPTLSDMDACTIDSCDRQSGVLHIPIPGCGVALTPPKLDPSVQWDFLAATTFLFSGPDAIQTGVTAGAIVPSRQSVIRGRALDVHSNPVRGLRVSARNHAELASPTREMMVGSILLRTVE